MASRKKGGKTTRRFVEDHEIREELHKNWHAITQQRAVVQQVFDEYHDELLSHPDICGIHVGLKRCGGKVVLPLQYAIRVHVKQKRPQNHPLLREAIDTSRFQSQNVEMDVLERTYRLLAGTKPTGTTKAAGPIVGGRPIGPTDFPDHWGTMGMVVFFGGQPHYLTNKHVAGNPGSSVSESAFGVTATGQTGVIGTVVNSIRDASVDCAIIAPSGNRKRELGILGPDGLLPGIYMPRKLTSVDEHKTEVFKIGARTGFEPIKVGVVKSVNTSIEVSGLTMTGQIAVESQDGETIVAPGDSGSIAIAKGMQDGIVVNSVVGLVFGETDPVAPGAAETGHTLLANHFENVESALRISLFPG